MPKKNEAPENKADVVDITPEVVDKPVDKPHMQAIQEAVELTIDLYTPKQLELIKRTVAKGATNDELAMFVHIAKKAGLDPFMKEIWFYKDNKNNTIIFAGRDGKKRNAENSGFLGTLKSGAVHENDEFSIDLVNKTVQHKIVSFANRGELIGAWAICERKDKKEPAIEYVENATYNKGHNTWLSHPDEMLRKVAEDHVLDQLFLINGVYSESEKDSIIASMDQKRVGAMEPQNQLPESTEFRDKLKAHLLTLDKTTDDETMIYFNVTGIEEYPATEQDAKLAYAQLLAKKN